MVRFLKYLCLITWLLAGIQSAHGFALLGPKEAYQIRALGFIEDFSESPKNLGEEYRINIKTLFYAFDANFLDYFGSNGVYAVDSAVQMLNGLTNVSSYSSELSEFPLEEMRLNYTASALHLMDLKSCTLEILVERLGLANPEEFIWNLRNAVVPPGAQCPNLLYTVIMRNFDPTTLLPTPYVNGNLFTYIILQGCNPQEAIALEEKVYDTQTTGSAVATGKIMFNDPSYWGWFHTGLTRDDIGALRYLYQTNNVNLESAPSNSVTFITNINNQLLFSSNLTLLASQALTNDAAALLALYPDLVITETIPIFTNVITTNVISFFTNYPWAPAGPPTLVSQTVITTNIATWFAHTFANVVTNFPLYYTNAYISILTTNIGPKPYGSPTTIYTNVTITPAFLTNIVSGEYFLLPTNAACGYSILSTQLTWLTFGTNTISIATNSAGATNQTALFSQSLLYYVTNHAYVVKAISCQGGTNSVALRQGIETVKFVRRDYDSLLNRFIYPVTNTYSFNVVTNNTLYTQAVRRVIDAPDIVFSAADIVSPPTTFPIVVSTVAREVPRWDQTEAGPGLIGPGIINPPVTFTFNKVGPIRDNANPFFNDETLAVLDFIWGSFDGTTNFPVIYPNGTDIYALESQILMQISPVTLATGKVGQAYSQPFSVIGGVAPYTWTLKPGSPDLPDGLSLLPSGLMVGTPAVAGTYDITIRLSDANVRIVDRDYTLTITP